MKTKAPFKTLIEIHRRRQISRQSFWKSKKMKKKMNKMKQKKKRWMMREIQLKNRNLKQL